MKKVKGIFACLFISLWLLIGLSFASWAKTGVLVIAHGSPSEIWNQPVRDTVAQVCLPYPVELGFLEFVEGETIQDAVDRLENQGVDEIIVSVIAFISSYSNHIEEIKYLLGLPYDEDVVDEEELGPPVESDAEFILSNAIDDHPLIAQVLCDRVRELSTNPSEEIVVITAHGAETKEDIAKWSENMQSLAARMKWELGVKDVRHSYVFPDVVEWGEPYLRDVVEEAMIEGNVIVIPLMISEGFFTQRYIPMQLEGLNYVYNGKTLSPHPGLARWIELSALKALVDLPPISIYDSEEGLLEITLDEVRAEEPMCCCRAAAFKACQEAFTNLWRDEIPQRDDIYIICSHPSEGHKEAFDYITKAVTRGDYELDIPEGTGPGNLIMENYRYRFINKFIGKGIMLRMKEQVFPKNFLEFRNWIRPMIKDGTATPAQKKAFMSAKQHFIDRILTTEEPFHMAIPGRATCLGSVKTEMGRWIVSFGSYYRWDNLEPAGLLACFNLKARKWVFSKSITSLLISEDEAEISGKLKMNGTEYSFEIKASGDHRGLLSIMLEGPECFKREMTGRVRRLRINTWPVSWEQENREFAVLQANEAER